MIAEAVGICILVTFGLGSVCTAVSTGAQVGLWQVAVVWGFGLSIAIYTVGSVSGGHFNPAVSLAFALLRPEAFSFMHLPFYWLAQLLGAMAGGAINLMIFHSFFDAQETLGGYVRGDEASIMTVVGWVGVFPSPIGQYKVEGDGLVLNQAVGW
jgi:glycerol uptake facilitator-like aquaporin